MAARIKKNDEVIILTGRSKNVTGKILRIYKNNTVIVEGANLIKKHVRPNPQVNEQGGIIEKEAPVHISNVALLLPVKKSKSSKKISKVGFKYLDDGRKVRYFKANNELVDVDI